MMKIRHVPFACIVWFAALMIVAALPVASSAYQVKAKVKLHTEKLTPDDREYLTPIADSLEYLISSYTWSRGMRNVNFPLNLEIYFDASNGRAGLYRSYSAAIILGTESGLLLKDRRWDFKISRELGFHIGEPYDTFTGLIEYYLWLAVGYDMDRYQPLSGTAFYDQALMVSERSRSEAGYQLGWSDRRSLVGAMEDTSHNAIRRIRTIIERGLYFASTKRWSDARDALTLGVGMLLDVEPEAVEFKRGDHDVKYVNLDILAAALKEIGMDGELEKLSLWDKAGANRYQR